MVATALLGGVRAATIHSDNDWKTSAADVDADQIELPLINPEGLIKPGFRERVLLVPAANAGLLVARTP